MAVRRGEDSKQGLIIALVFFVLLSIGLGVAAYFFRDGQQALRDKADKAEKAKAQMEKSRDWESFQKLYLKVYLGQALTQKEKDEFAAAVPRYEGNQLGDDTKADFDSLSKLMRDKMGWDGALPKKTYFARVNELEAAVRQKDEQLAKVEETNKAALTDFNEKLASNQKATDKLKEELGQTKKELADLTNKKSAEFQAALRREEDRNVEVDKAKKEKEDVKEEMTKNANKLMKELKEKDTLIGQLNDKIKPPNVLDYDKPKGKVTSLEPGQPVVYINLGWADNVKPQLTFSIYGVGPDGKTQAQRKGALEVANVIEAHLSRARITELTDANRDPVLRGDLLFNPVWHSTLRTHVAIAGVIDLTGEGTNDTAEFIKGLQRQGIIVDAWLDLKDLTIKPPDGAISLKTTYLVLGDRPEINEAPVGAADRLTTDKAALIKKMSEMQEEAIKLGVTVIPFRRFLAVIGYPTPRLLTTRTGSSGYLDSLLLNTGGQRREAEKDKGDKDGKEKGDKAAPKEKGKGDKEETKDKEK
jgi:hypothetical protein